MRPIAPVARALAEQVLRFEGQAQSDPAAGLEAFQRADERLRERLVVLIGSTGYSALLSRAVRLAQEEFPMLQAVTADATAPGSMQPLNVAMLARTENGVSVTAGLVAILAHLFGLLVAFIGEDISVRLIRETWPELGEARDATGDGGEERG